MFDKPNAQIIRQQSLRALIHLVSLGAILLLLFNDHWLRWNYPSSFTGKLGDVTWLIFAFFPIIFLLSLLMPKRWGEFVPLLGFAGSGFLPLATAALRYIRL